jgi:predicted PhzF superfamily epimerase YddE/YHI9
VKISKLARPPANWRTHGACSAATTLGAAAYTLMRDGFAKIMMASSANGRSPFNRRARHRNLMAAPMVEPGVRNNKRTAEIAACLHTRTSCAAREAGKPVLAIPVKDHAAHLEIAPRKPQQRRSRSSCICSTLSLRRNTCKHGYEAARLSIFVEEPYLHPLVLFTALACRAD